MSETNLGTIAVRCPHCGSAKLSQGSTPETQDDATCSVCGKRFSLKAEVAKIGNAVQKGIADAFRKAIK